MALLIIIAAITAAYLWALLELSSRQKRRNYISTIVFGPDDPSPLLEGRNFYKPFAYPRFYQRYINHERMDWKVTEINFVDDKADWITLDAGKKAFVTNIARFFTQGDVDVASAYCSKYLPMLRHNPEVSMFLASVANREGKHIDAYAHIIDVLDLPESTFKEFLEYKEMSEKQEYINRFNNEYSEYSFFVRALVRLAALASIWYLCFMNITCVELFVLVAATAYAFSLIFTRNLASLPVLILVCLAGMTSTPLFLLSGVTILIYLGIVQSNVFRSSRLEHRVLSLALFSGLIEGVQLFGSFMMLLALPMENKMKGVGNIVRWSIADENEHVRGATDLYRIMVRENRESVDRPRWATAVFHRSGIDTAVLEPTIHKIARDVVNMEHCFATNTFALYGDGERFSKHLDLRSLKMFICYLTDRRLSALNCAPVYNITDNPLQNFEALISAGQHSNIFEATETEYSQPITGDWTEVCKGFGALNDDDPEMMELLKAKNLL